MINDPFRVYTVGEASRGFFESLKRKQDGDSSPIDIEYHTTDAQLACGICVCSECGKLCSTDYKWCSYCLKQVVVISKEKMKKERANEWQRNYQKEKYKRNKNK